MTIKMALTFAVVVTDFMNYGKYEVGIMENIW